jgi:MFS family permease
LHDRPPKRPLSDVPGTDELATPPDEAASLFQHPQFRRLWAGDAISQLGSELAGLALPVLAIETFSAGALEMGILEACSMVAFLLVGLPAGAWVDRGSKRRVLVVADVVRALALASVPLAIVLGIGSLNQLFVVAFVVGTCAVFFDVAWQSYLPVLLRGEQLLDGNSKLSATQAVAGVAGPAAGGALIRAFGAPIVVTINAVSFVAAAIAVRRIVDDEPPHDPTTRRPLRTEVAEGMRFVLGSFYLRRITESTALTNLAFSTSGAVTVLYLLGDLDQSVTDVGIVFAVGSVGALLGAVTTSRFCRLVGEGRAIPISAAAGLALLVSLPVAGWLPVPVIVTVGVGSVIGGWSVVTYNVTIVSFRQRLCPPHLYARMNASVRFLVWGTLPIGSLLGGVLGEALGIVPTLWISVGIGAIAIAPVVMSPLARMRVLPTTHAAGPRV